MKIKIIKKKLFIKNPVPDFKFKILCFLYFRFYGSIKNQNTN